jgi:acetyl esterase
MGINPELDGFLKEWGNQWSSLPAGAGPKERRSHFEKVAANMALPIPEGLAEETVHWVPSTAGDVRVRVFRFDDDHTQPCLIYMHGGAWMQGSPETHADITRKIAALNKQTVISVDYALAPEHPFPTAVNQCADVVRWAFAEASQLRIDPQKIAAGGDSAGANLAAALTLIFREDADISLLAQLLVYPPVDFEQKRAAYVENANAPLLQTAGMNAVNAMYCPNPDDLHHPLAAPMFAEDHSGLPPAFIAVAENDPLRDDGIDYAAKLKDSGVAVDLDRGEGLIHGYLRAMAYCAASTENLEKMCAWLAARNAG